MTNVCNFFEKLMTKKDKKLNVSNGLP